MDLEKFSEITSVYSFPKSKVPKTNITIVPFGNYYIVSSQKRIESLKLFDLSGREIGIPVLKSDAYNTKFTVNLRGVQSNKVLLKVYTKEKMKFSH